MKFTLLILLLFSILLISGCAHKTPQSIAEIQDKKDEQQRRILNITYESQYDMYLDRSNRINFICKQGTACNYYDSNRHSYKNLFVEEEIIGLSKGGYAPLVRPYNRQCGKGSMLGIFSFIGPNDSFRDYTRENGKYCRYRYTKIKSTQISTRFLVGLITFMTSFITGGNMHTREFDEESFRKALTEANIESYREEFFKLTAGHTIEGGFDMVYLDQGDIQEDLEAKYEALLTSHSKKAGVIFLDAQTHEMLSIIVFDAFKDKTLMAAISLELDTLIANAAKHNKHVLKNEEVIAYIPPEIILPSLPEIKKPIKSEFETLAVFNAKVQGEVLKREMGIRELQRKYSHQVNKRNRFIQTLQTQYAQYIKTTAKMRSKLVVELQENIPLLAKILFLENTSGYKAKNFQYDAESQKLFFEINSENLGFKQKVFSYMPSEIAIDIKEKSAFKIIPEVAYVNNTLQLKGFKILDTLQEEGFVVSYTDVDFTPEVVSITVVGEKEIIDKELAQVFEQYKQADKEIVDRQRKEIWYVDVANRVNAKVPQWFANPLKEEGVVAYGEGNTLLEAKHNAREELANIVKIKVKSSYESTLRTDGHSSSKDIQLKSVQSSDLELTAEDYKLLRQDSIDGKWYVAFRYLR